MLVLGKFLSFEVGIGIQCNAQLHVCICFLQSMTALTIFVGP